MIARAIKWLRRLPARRADTRLLQRSIPDVDAMLVSYPKSGRTWLRFALSCYFARAAALDLVPDLVSTFRVLPNLDRDPLRGLPAFAYAARPGVPLIAVSHRRYEGPLFLDRPVIFLIRDPRDVVVSAYFHATRHKHRYRGTLKNFIRDPQQGLSDILRYLNGWAEGLSRHRQLVITYEGMSADPVGVMREILSFLDLPADQAALAHAAQASQFDAMRQSEQQSGIPGHDYDRSDSESLRMRKGKAGGFREYLDQEDIDLIDARCRTELSPAARLLVLRTGMPLPAGLAAKPASVPAPFTASGTVGASR